MLRLKMAGKSLFFKVILLGDGGVGKSSLMNRYVSNKLDTQLFYTIGVEFLNKDLEVDGHFVTIQIWDTAEAQAWCWDNSDHPYFETSAKDATNVTAAFEEAVRRVLATEYRSDHLIQTDTISLHRKPKPSSSCC
uniref:RAB9A, member RAS oncogene family n=1 Tax=Monodon monoceros TaxID=40151 RepID=A0A8C6B1H0_MONMO